MSDHDLSKYATNEPAALLWFERANYIAVNLGLIAYGTHKLSLCNSSPMLSLADFQACILFRCSPVHII